MKKNISLNLIVKYLGIISDSKITWALAKKKKKKRTSLGYSMLRGHYPPVSKISKLKKNIEFSLYKTCIRPIIIYGHQIWTVAAKTRINKIQKMQKKFFYIIFNKPYDILIRELQAIANIPTIQEYISNSLTTAYRPNHHIHSSATLGNTNIPLKTNTRLPNKQIANWHSLKILNKYKFFETFFNE